MAGRLGGTKVLGLPGNPVSSLICGLLFLKPLMQAMLGQTPEQSGPQRAILASPLPENDRRQDYVRATLSRSEHGDLVVTPFSRQDSSMLNLLAKSGALVVRPPHAPALEAGAEVPILVL
jgi:molybdopterin molybdotransferase